MGERGGADEIGMMGDEPEDGENLYERLFWLPWRGTAYAVPQYRGSIRFFFFAPSERMNVIGE